MARKEPGLSWSVIEFFRIGAKELRSNEAGEKNKKNEYTHVSTHTETFVSVSAASIKSDVPVDRSPTMHSVM